MILVIEFVCVLLCSLVVPHKYFVDSIFWGLVSPSCFCFGQGHLYNVGSSMYHFLMTYKRIFAHKWDIMS
jgi:hypothetical protein